MFNNDISHPLVKKNKYLQLYPGILSQKIISKYILLAEHLIFTQREGDARTLLENLDFNNDDIQSFLIELRFARDNNLVTVELTPDDLLKLSKGEFPKGISINKSILN